GSYAGFSLQRPPGNATPYAAFTAVYVPQSVPPHGAVHPDGTRRSIPPPVHFSDPHELAYPTAEVPPETYRNALTVRAPLGRVAYARSRDRAGDVTVGVWVPAGQPRRAETYAWLRTLLSADTVRRLLPET